jgi:hypothetical protein
MNELVFDCLSARNERYAVTPTLSFTLRISETSGRLIDAIALRCQIRIQPQQRRYDDVEAARLLDLFGEPPRWAETVKPIQLATVSTMVPGFTGSIEIDVPVPCTYDLEVGWARYINSLESGMVPLLMLFSGTVFSTVEGRMSVQQVPWSKEASFALPVTVWRDLVDTHFPNTSWIRIHRETLEALLLYKSRNALPTWDSTIETLLADAKGATS